MKKGKMRLILEDHWCSFVKKYDDTILKVDTNDFNKAAREIKSLEDEINSSLKINGKEII